MRLTKGAASTRLEDRSLVKDSQVVGKKMQEAEQMHSSNVVSEDPRFAESPPPPLSEEFPNDTKVFFLGEHAYGLASKVSSTQENSLSIAVAVCVSNRDVTLEANRIFLVFPFGEAGDREN
jgi:5'-3' exoribonuclease 1